MNNIDSIMNRMTGVVHDSWVEFITDQKVQTALKNAVEKIYGNLSDISCVTPEQDLVLRFLSVDLSKVCIVMIGQDPYRERYAANGRAFQPAELFSWQQPFSQRALQNIIRAIYAAENDIITYENIPVFTEIREKIAKRRFLITEPPVWFDNLEKQGVLFLNASLTCIVGESDVHRDIWDGFTGMVIKYIASQRDAKWFLFGKNAMAYRPLLGNAKCYIGRHPTYTSAKFKDDILYNPCFRETKDLIDWTGIKAVL